MWDPPLLFGHRGAPGGDLRENTIPSFERAVLDGATALETDAHRTRDGSIVLSHDENLQRVFGIDLEIRAHTLAEIQAVAAVPTLADVLARFPSHPINVDIKQRDPPMERELLDVIEHAQASHRVLLASFHGDALERVRALGYRGPTCLSRSELARILLLPVSALRLWRVRGARAQVPRHSGLARFDTPSFIDKCHALGVAVDFWTINAEHEARELLALGADGIMSDSPAAVRPAIAARADENRLPFK